jgi:hypothetical protein
MKKISKREALKEVALFQQIMGDIPQWDYNRWIQSLNKMSDTQINAKFQELKATVNGKALPKTNFSEDTIVKEFDSLGESKNDYDIAGTNPVPKYKKKEYSYKEKLQKIASTLNHSTDPQLKELAKVSGNLYKWDAKLVDQVFDTLNNLK